MKDNIILNKSFNYALKVIELSHELNQNKEFILSKQLLDLERPLEQMREKRTTLQQKKTSYTNSPFHRKNVMKVYIG
jgi:hypothetical protein